MQKVLLMSNVFEAPDEFIKYIKSLGYNSYDYKKNFKLMFDEKVINFVEKRTTEFMNKKIYKGKKSYEYRIGFAGLAVVKEVDTSKEWIISYDNLDIPFIQYIDLNINEYGYVKLKKGVD